MAKKITIKLGEPQPVECNSCGEKSGYQVTDKIRTTYTMVYESSGRFELGEYGDSLSYVSRDTRPSCARCGEKLNFKINRNIIEWTE